jgi:succinate dehydrogenase/fumarate reductase flavoprotein subunit
MREYAKSLADFVPLSERPATAAVRKSNSFSTLRNGKNGGHHEELQATMDLNCGVFQNRGYAKQPKDRSAKICSLRYRNLGLDDHGRTYNLDLI